MFAAEHCCKSMFDYGPWAIAEECVYWSMERRVESLFVPVEDGIAGELLQALVSRDEFLLFNNVRSASWWTPQ
jgi:hypothetical protein